ncbi:NADH-quinone oxidoreductase subunit NuoH [Allobranchiibius sp. CTAmp26]|uniref:NADH-quinone oxidoreductase subunit NuoH n=1 Tax=Allobranchiibius sp. CTAmp26 TaxID=2815214 RepID=UPI001AA17D2D|nr:NADH-quinone oxidoreductase subunit NuoH [Allobranchiibius sp. CTAmp26]MBO1755108.1 NADH-quinone oxidoreductase subunit NuoH [Allobranchiibius sp. CTAmp26]
MTQLSHLAALGAATGTPAADFSDTPWWLSLIKAVLLFVFLLVQTLLVIWFERRVIGRMQQRPGPNRVGPFGLLQTLADGVKLALKEDLTPKNADKLMFLIAPIIAGAMAFVSFAIIPVSGNVWMFGHYTPLQLTDTPVAVLLVLAVAGVGVYGIVLAGWSSGSTYPLLGGLRSSAQVISYEIAMGLALVAVFLYAGSMSTSQIVLAQGHGVWYIIPAFFSFIIYVVTMVGETNRLPFDLAEGEGELTGGFHTEYSSLKFAMFFLGEYVNMFTVSALATTLFLGGWQAPPGIAAIDGGLFNHGWWGVLWFVVKLWIFMFFFVWLRGSLPRVRYDQFMKLGWKLMIPSTLVWVVVIAFIRASNAGFLGETQISLLGRDIHRATLIVIAATAVLVLAAAWVWDAGAARRQAVEDRNQVPDEIDPFAGGHPVPPLPGQRLVEPVPVLTAASGPRATTRESRREDDVRQKEPRG